jgi:hypothetical protein
MKQVIIKRGKSFSEDVQAPIVNENTVLVQVYYSCISAGIEISRAKSSGESLMRKALRQPERVKEVISNVKREGVFRTIKKVQGKLERCTQTEEGGGRIIGEACRIFHYFAMLPK